MIPEIEVDPDKQTVTVRGLTFSSPILWFNGERDLGIKSRIVIEHLGKRMPNHPKDRHKLMCDELGPRFNERFYKAMHNAWITPHFPKKIWPCMVHSWKYRKPAYSAFHVKDAHRQKDRILGMMNTDMETLIPFVIRSAKYDLSPFRDNAFAKNILIARNYHTSCSCDPSLLSSLRYRDIRYACFFHKGRRGGRDLSHYLRYAVRGSDPSLIYMALRDMQIRPNTYEELRDEYILHRCLQVID